MLLSYHHLRHIVEADILEGALPENINSASIDVRLGNTILFESFIDHVADLSIKQPADLQQVILEDDEYYDLKPGEFILAQTVEKFNLPKHIACEFRLKSTAARNGLDQALAVWCDPGWYGSVLTIELKNNLRHQTLRLRPGMKIGQVVFFQCFPVPDEASYAVKGQYNNDVKTQAGKELK